MLQKQFCMNCGNQVDPAADACHACGTPIPKMPAPGGFSASVSNSVPMQFCANCGNTIGGNLNNCPSCGAPVANVPISGNAAAMNGKKTNLLIPLIIGIVVIAFIIISCIIVFGRSNKGPLDNFVTAVEDCDVDACIALCPEEWIDKMKDQNNWSDREFEYYVEDELEESIDRIEDNTGDDMSVSYEIRDEEHMDEYDIEKIEEYYKYYDYSGYEIDDIEDAYEVDVKFTFEGDDDEQIEKRDITIIKVDGEWVAPELWHWLV